MRWFKKKAPDVVDLTKLRDSGVLDRSLKVAKQNDIGSTHDGEVVDLSISSSESSSITSSGGGGGGDFGFLSGLAGAGSGESSESITGNLREARVKNVAGQELKLKIEDIEYKLDRFIERLEKIEKKLRD
jgi:hypothetical protein